MRRHTVAILTALTLAVPLAGCGQQADTDLSGIEADSMDCDAEDRRKKEIPDCGRKVNGKYREWSWVAKGSKPPAGWTPARESAAASSRPTPRTTVRTATGGGTDLLDGRSRRTTTRKDSSTTRKNGSTTNRRS